MRSILSNKDSNYKFDLQFYAILITSSSNIKSSCMQIVSRVFITGSNRGIGKELVKLLNKKYPQMEIHISSRGDPA
jgi:hypothetical protein